MINIISWLLFPIWIDYERIGRKSKGIKGYIQSIVFYHTVFMSIVKDYGMKMAICLYTVLKHKDIDIMNP